MGRFFRHRPSEQHDRVQQVLAARGTYSAVRRWFAAILAELPEGQPLEDDALALLCRSLRDEIGAGFLDVAEDHEAKLHLWRTLADRFPSSARLQAILADTMLAYGVDRDDSLRLLLAAMAREPVLYGEFAGDFFEVAHDLGGSAALELRLAELRYAAGEMAEDEDHLRVLVDQLLTDYGGDAGAVERIRELAREIMGE